jgi:hypothetical protein
LAEQSRGHLVSCGGEVANAVGVGFGACLDHLEELCRRLLASRRYVEEPLEPAGPGGEVGESGGGGDVPGVQGHPTEGGEGQIPCWRVTGPAKSQSKNPASVPRCQAAL